MKKSLIGLLLVTFMPKFSWADEYYQMVDEFGKKTDQLNIEKYFKDQKLPDQKINFDQEDLLKVLVNTSAYFENFENKDPVFKKETALSSLGINNAQVKKTLDFMAKIVKEDLEKKQPSRLKDINFLNKNFRVIKWNPYNPKKLEQDQLRITKYAVFEHEGSLKKTARFDLPLYGIKDSVPEEDLFYKKYTKQDIVSGLLEKNPEDLKKVEVLAYLDRNGLEEALMEGTVLLNFDNGSSKYFNVFKNNGISYIKGLEPRKQKRFWFFRESSSINGYGIDFDSRIKVEAGVTFAGDIFNIGLGKIIFMSYQEGKNTVAKIGVIADTGGAFLPNTHQLDFLSGVFKDHPDFNKRTAALPSYADVYFLVKK